MFKLNENYETDQSVRKSVYIRYSLAKTSIINTPNSQIDIKIPREDSVIRLLNSYFDLICEVIEKNDKSRYRNGNDKTLANLEPIALFSNFKLITGSAKHLEEDSHAQIVSLMYKLITSSKDSDDLSIGFDRNRNRRKDELAQSKNIKCNYHLRIMLKDVFGFAECQEKVTYGLGYKLTLTGNKNYAAIDKAAGVDDARMKIDLIRCYVPHCLRSIQQHGTLSNQNISKIQTELRFFERSDFMKEVENQNHWKFELGSQENMNVPIWITIDFQQQDRQDSQNLNKNTFCRLTVTKAQEIIGTKKYVDAGIILNYDDDD